MTGGTVVILGDTGRNFGAGMSGGVAYVWDPDQTLTSRANQATITISRLTESDAAPLQNLIEMHVAHTGSLLGKRLLAAWRPGDFAYVLPHEYAAYLEGQRAATHAEAS